MTRVRPHPHADVLVVGSGASGAIASLVLGEAGLKVVCLEQGGWTEPTDHPHFSPDWEWQRVRRWSPNGNIRRHADLDGARGTKEVLEQFRFQPRRLAGEYALARVRGILTEVAQRGQHQLPGCGA